MSLIRGFTCGSFDLLHPGHILMFRECKRFCDYLIVGLQSDPTIDRSSKNKPVQSLEERYIMLSSVKEIDEICHYNTESDLVKLLTAINPNVRILGADWEGRDYTGKDLPIKVVFNSRDHSYSTSSLRQRIYEAEKKRRGE